MSNLVEQLCELHNCSAEQLEYYIDRYFAKTCEYLVTHWIRTIHLKRNRLVRFHGLTYSKTKNLHAYNGYLDITVPQHYYAKHKILLRHLNLPCLREKGGGCHVSYFPLEVLKAY